MTGLLVVFTTVDEAVAARLRRLGLVRRTPSYLPRILATSAAAVGIAIVAFTVPEAGFGRSLTTDSRGFTFFPGDSKPPAQIAPTSVGSPTITGEAAVGETLSGFAGRWSGRPAPTFELRWLRCGASGGGCAAIGGGSTLTLGDELAGSTIVLDVVARNGAGEARGRSAATDRVAAATPADVRPSNLERPAIRGVARVGEPLTGVAGRWSGRPAPRLELRWLQCGASGGGCTAIARGSSFAPGEQVAGAAIVFEVIARNGAGEAHRRSVATAPVAVTNPVDVRPSILARPTISGLARVGETLSGDVGRWNGRPAPTLELRWLRCDAAGESCIAIAGGGDATLALGEELAGTAIVFEVSARNREGEARGRSAATAPVASIAPVDVRPSNLEQPTISGLARVGETLSGDVGRWNGRPAPTLELQWLRCDAGGGSCTAIAGTTRSEYAPSRSDLGATLVLQVTARNAAGTRTASSRPSKPVDAVPLNLQPPSISGRATVGKTLTATPGSWSAYPSVTVGYRWLRCDNGGDSCIAVGGATAATLVLGTKDAGFTFRVEETASNSLGATAASSGPSPIVSRAPVAPFNRRLPVVRYSSESGALRFTVYPGLWGGTPRPRFSYRWQYCGGLTCVNITPRGRSYTPLEGQPDCGIRVIVTARNEAGSRSATSTIVKSCVE